MIGKTQLAKFAFYNGFNMLFQKFNIPLYKPFRVTFLVTFNCNLKCRNCHAWKYGREAMGVAEGKDYITKLMEWIKHPFYLSFSGGEPLLLGQDLFNMIKFASMNGVLTNITSNGTLINNSVKQSLVDSRLYSLNISLDSLNPDVHDSIRGKKGTYKKVMKGVSLMKSSNVKLNISTTIMEENYKDLLELVKWVGQNKLNSITFQPLQPPSWRTAHVGRTWFKKADSWPKTEGVAEVINSLIKMKKENYPIANSLKHLLTMKDYFRNPLTGFNNISCMAGKNYLCIDFKGNLFFCMKYGSVGNLRASTPKGIFKSNRCKHVLKEVNSCKKEPCLLCKCYFEESILEEVSRFFRR